MENEIAARKPDKIGDGTSKHVKRNAKLTLIAAACLALLNVFCFAVWPTVWPVDPKELLRWSVEKSQHVSMYGFGITFWIWFMDWLSNGNFIGTILREPRACAIFLGLLCVGWALVFVCV